MSKKILTFILLVFTVLAYWFFPSEQDITAAPVSAKFTVPEETGALDVYFCPQDNCSIHFEKYIRGTKNTIHCALFDLDLQNIITAFNEIADYSDVKLVIDNNNKKGLNADYIRFDNNNQLSHNKFCIRDGLSVWTGSFNPTYRGAYENNNNVLMFESASLAKNYESEFDELWNGQFGKGQLVPNPSIKYNGFRIENYFCPEDHCADHIIELLKTAKNSIYFMTFSFTHDGIGDEIIAKHKKGVDVKGVFEKSQNNQYLEKPKMESAGIKVKWDSNKANMHHKVFIIDEEIVITGSMNPSKNGDENNDENILVIHNRDIAKLYVDEFERVYS